MQLLIRWRDSLVVTALLLLILGLRISIGAHFVAQIPQGDDYRTLFWLQHFSEGVHNWGFLWMRPNGHFFVLYYLINLVQYGLNGYWDPRLDFLTYSVIHTLEAAAVLFTFRNLLEPRDRWWLYGLILFIFATPFGGYRIAWGNLYAYTNVIVFALPAIYWAVYRGGIAWYLVVALTAAIGALNIGAGCLGGLSIAVFLAFRSVVLRRVVTSELILAGSLFLLFVACFGTMPKGTTHIGFFEAINAFLKAIAWPVVFTPLAGLFTLVPLAGLAGSYFFLPQFRSRKIEFTIATGILVCLLALATGAFRGDANNMGIPSGRYTDLFVIVPLVALVSLCHLCRESTGASHRVWALYAWFWVGLQVLGFSIHVLYRTIPFIGNETGEWVEPAKQTTFRDAARNPALPLLLKDDTLYDESLDIPREQHSHAEIEALVHGQERFPAMTLPMIAGFPLLPGSGNYITGGYPSFYAPRPGENYVGSFDPANRRTPKQFTSQPFTPQAPYIVLDLLVDKKARFTNYHLPGLELALVDQTAGSRVELLPRLARTFPFIFRDWESIYAKVIPGHTYVLDSQASDINPFAWLAFSEPIESGWLTPWTVGLFQSGKLICLIALGLLVLAAGLHRDYLGLLGEPDAVEGEPIRR